MVMYCPHCQSSNFVVIQQNQSSHQGNDDGDASSLLKSMAGLATLGVTIAKQTSFASPLAGGLAGVVLGGLFGSSTPSRSAPRHVTCFTLFCKSCEHVFEMQRH